MPLDLAHLDRRLADLGAKPVHRRAVLRAWTSARPLDHGARDPERFLPSSVRAALPALAADWSRVARVRSTHPAQDGAARLLVELADGEAVEAVLLPPAGLCVSTQAGCAVGCVFCRTGQDGLRRQLGSAEIVGQVAAARALRPVTKIVFMGMGEPAHNLDAVLDAIDWLGREGEIGHKNLVLSTVGDARVFERLPGCRVRPALALSLHSTFAERRAALLPRAPRLPPEALIEAAERYARATHYPIQYQWTLIAGVNDGDDEVERIATLLAGKYAVMNLIPWNAVDGLGYRRPDPRHAASIAARLNHRGVLTKLRQSAAQDVDGGCGQLRGRATGAAATAPIALVARR